MGQSGMELMLMLGQVALLTLLAPLVAGIIKKIEAWMQNRVGSSIWQEYYDLAKWWGKPTMLTPATSNIFIYAPFIYLLSVLLAAALLPGMVERASFGNIFVFISVLAAGRFFMCLSSLDAGTAFGGMGGSREIYFSVLIEPVLLLGVLAAVLHQGTASLTGLVLDAGEPHFTVNCVLAAFGFFALLLAENGRKPVDNPDTHLELTMIHECMTLEYSGRLLALIHIASMLKTLVFVLLFCQVFLPLPLPLLVKVLLTMVAIAGVEGLNNKMRLFKVRFYMAGAGIFMLLAIVAQ